MTLEETMQKIRPVDAAAMAAAKQHWDGLGKPLGSLGRLEKALIQIAGISAPEMCILIGKHWSSCVRIMVW